MMYSGGAYLEFWKGRSCPVRVLYNFPHSFRTYGRYWSFLRVTFSCHPNQIWGSICLGRPFLPHSHRFKIHKESSQLTPNNLGSYYSVIKLLANYINPLKPKIAWVILNNSVRPAKRKPHFTITKINWLMLLKEILPVYSKNHRKPINLKCR
jgi:hypothetical protein